MLSAPQVAVSCVAIPGMLVNRSERLRISSSLRTRNKASRRSFWFQY
jgi:hypothetical protein